MKSTQKSEGLVFFKKACNGFKDLRAVAKRGKLRLAALGAISILDGHINNAPTFINRMDGEFGFNLEALGKHGHGFHENAIERTVTRHHIVECKAINGF